MSSRSNVSKLTTQDVQDYMTHVAALKSNNVNKTDDSSNSSNNNSNNSNNNSSKIEQRTAADNTRGKLEHVSKLLIAQGRSDRSTANTSQSNPNTARRYTTSETYLLKMVTGLVDEKKKLKQLKQKELEQQQHDAENLLISDNKYGNDENRNYDVDDKQSSGRVSSRADAQGPSKSEPLPDSLQDQLKLLAEERDSKIAKRRAHTFGIQRGLNSLYDEVSLRRSGGVKIDIGDVSELTNLNHVEDSIENGHTFDGSDKNDIYGSSKIKNNFHDSAKNVMDSLLSEQGLGAYYENLDKIRNISQRDRGELSDAASNAADNSKKRLSTYDYLDKWLRDDISMQNALNNRDNTQTTREKNSKEAQLSRSNAVNPLFADKRFISITDSSSGGNNNNNYNNNNTNNGNSSNSSSLEQPRNNVPNYQTHRMNNSPAYPNIQNNFHQNPHIPHQLLIHSSNPYSNNPYSNPYNNPYSNPYNNPYSNPYMNPYSQPYNNPYIHQQQIQQQQQQQQQLFQQLQHQQQLQYQQKLQQQQQQQQQQQIQQQQQLLRGLGTGADEYRDHKNYRVHELDSMNDNDGSDSNNYNNNHKNNGSSNNNNNNNYEEEDYGRSEKYHPEDPNDEKYLKDEDGDGDIDDLDFELQKLRMETDLEKQIKAIEFQNKIRKDEEEHKSWIQMQRMEMEAINIKQVLVKERQTLNQQLIEMGLSPENNVTDGSDRPTHLVGDDSDKQSQKKQTLNNDSNNSSSTGSASAAETSDDTSEANNPSWLKKLRDVVGVSKCGDPSSLPILPTNTPFKTVGIFIDGLLLNNYFFNAKLKSYKDVDDVFRVVAGIFDADERPLAKFATSEWQRIDPVVVGNGSFYSLQGSSQAQFLTKIGAFKRVVNQADSMQAVGIGSKVMIEIQTRNTKERGTADRFNTLGWSSLSVVVHPPQGLSQGQRQGQGVGNLRGIDSIKGQNNNTSSSSNNGNSSSRGSTASTKAPDAVSVGPPSQNSSRPNNDSENNDKNSANTINTKSSITNNHNDNSNTSSFYYLRSGMWRSPIVSGPPTASTLNSQSLISAVSDAGDEFSSGFRSDIGEVLVRIVDGSEFIKASYWTPGDASFLVEMDKDYPTERKIEVDLCDAKNAKAAYKAVDLAQNDRYKENQVLEALRKELAELKRLQDIESQDVEFTRKNNLNPFKFNKIMGMWKSKSKQKLNPLGSLEENLIDSKADDIENARNGEKKSDSNTQGVNDVIEAAEEHATPVQSHEVRNESWILGTATGPCTVKYERGQGIDLYIDKAMNLPDTCAVSRVNVKVVNFERELISSTKDSVFEAVSIPNSPAISPDFSLKCELRGPLLHHTAIAIIRIDMIDCVTLTPVCIGYSVVKLFSDVNRKQPSPTQHADSVFINTGLFQIPLYYGNRLPISNPLTDNICDTMTRIPCASVLVRITTAPLSADRNTILSVSMFDKIEWERMGVFARPPKYSSGEYDGTLCEPNETENLIYPGKKKLLVVSSETAILQAIEDNLPRLGAPINKEKNNKVVRFPKMPKDPDAESLLQWFVSMFPPDSSFVRNAYNPIYSIPFLLDLGLNISIDCLYNMPESGFLKSYTTLYKAIYSIIPPGLYYKDPPLNESVLFTSFQNWNAPLKMPTFVDGFVKFNPPIVDKSLYLIIDVRMIKVNKDSRKDNPIISVEKPSPTGSFWTILPLTLERVEGQGYKYINCGTFQLPLFTGTIPSDQIFSGSRNPKGESSYEEVLKRLASKSKNNSLKLLEGASVIVRVANNAIKDMMIDQLANSVRSLSNGAVIADPMQSANGSNGSSGGVGGGGGVISAAVASNSTSYVTFSSINTRYIEEILSAASIGITGPDVANFQRFKYQPDSEDNKSLKSTMKALPEIDDFKKFTKSVNRAFSQATGILEF